MLLMLLVVLLCCPRPSRANEEDKKFQLQAILCSTPEWSLLETLVTAPLVGSYNVQNSSPLQKLLSRFIPVSGTRGARRQFSQTLPPFRPLATYCSNPSRPNQSIPAVMAAMTRTVAR